MQRVIPFKKLIFEYSISIALDYSYRVWIAKYEHERDVRYNFQIQLKDWGELETAKAYCQSIETRVRAGNFSLQDGELKRII